MNNRASITKRVIQTTEMVLYKQHYVGHIDSLWLVATNSCSKLAQRKNSLLREGNSG